MLKSMLSFKNAPPPKKKHKHRWWKSGKVEKVDRFLSASYVDRYRHDLDPCRTQASLIQWKVPLLPKTPPNLKKKICFLNE